MKKFIILISCILTIYACSTSRQTSVKASLPQPEYYVSAYIWPSCHDDSLAHEYLWTEGIGEWEVIKKGNPRFEGHYQPKQPLWGYEMDNDPVVVEKWIQTALKYGVNTFCYDWYWFKHYPYLESALNDGFLKAPSNEKMNFYIMWANHNVVYNYWNYHKWGDNTDLLFDPKVGWEDFKIIVDRVINQYFTKPNYLKFDGCPVFAIFSTDLFIAGFENKAEAAKAMDYFRQKVKEAGFKDLYLMETEGGGFYLDETKISKLKEKQKLLNINAFSFYNMGGRKEDYLAYGKNSITIREQWDKAFDDVPVYPCVSIGWDDTPRFPKKGIKDVVHYHNTPTAFASYLQKAKEYADSHPEQPKLITINAWNEWVEGSYLLPDKLNGYGYLQAVKDVFDGKFE